MTLDSANTVYNAANTVRSHVCPMRLTNTYPTRFSGDGTMLINHVDEGSGLSQCA
jgi:hypothetical protein